jgi:transcriptional regulator with XRE-family HTH domain
MNTQVVSPIRKYREQIGMTQLELAAKTGLGQSRLSNYERLERAPDIPTARIILKVLKSKGAKVASIDDLYPRNPS